MKIRKAKKEDVKRILELFNSDPNLIGDNQLLFKENHIEQYVGGPIFKTFVAIVDEKIVGAITAQFWKKAKYVYLDDVIVLKDYRKKNIGIKLVNHIEEIAKKNNMNLIWFISEEKDFPMHNLSMKLNYSKGKKFNFFSKVLK